MKLNTLSASSTPNNKRLTRRLRDTGLPSALADAWYVSHCDWVPHCVMSQAVTLSVAALVSSDLTAYDWEWPGCPVACLPRSLLCARPVLSPPLPFLAALGMLLSRLAAALTVFPYQVKTRLDSMSVQYTPYVYLRTI